MNRIALKFDRFSDGKTLYFLLIFLFSTLLSGLPAAAGTVTWDGGGGDNNWSTAANWTGDSLPAVNDDVVFDGTSTKNCTVDVIVNVASLSINSGYSGTITQSSALGVTGNFSQAAGTLSGGSSRIGVGGDFTLSSGTFTSTSGTLVVGGHFTHSGGTFNHNSGTVDVGGGFLGVTTQAGMDGGNGGWNTLFGNNPVNDSLDLASDEDTINDSERAHATEAVEYWVFNSESGFNIKNSGGTVIGEVDMLPTVGNSWVTVPLDNSYTNPVVIASYALESAAQPPAVTRIRNVSSSSFDLKIQNPGGGSTPDPNRVYYLVLEEGVHTLPGSVNLEAGTVTSDGVNHNGDWSSSLMEQITPSNSYGSPVVLNQVMSYNDASWQASWCSDGTQSGEPSDETTIYVGRNVAEDGDTTRANETIGWVVLDQGSDSTNGVTWDSALGSDSVQGVDDSPPYTYSLGYSVSKDLDLASSTTFNNLTISDSGTRTIKSNDLDVDGDLTIASGTLDANGTGNYNITVEGVWNNSDGTFTDRNGTVTFDGSNGGNITTNGSNFYDLTINGSGALWELQDNVTVDQNLDVSAGEFDANGNNVTINGNYTQGGGTFSTGTGVIDFDADASGDTVTISGGTLEIESDDSPNDINLPAGSWSNSGGTISYTAPESIILEDDFDPSTDGSDWAALNSATADSCTANSGSNSLFFSSSSATRSANTVDVDVSSGGSISYYFWLGDGGSCGETPESADDLQVDYSTDGGSSWTTIKTIEVESFSNGTWISDSISIPGGAETASTRFRWYQPDFSTGGPYDEWRIDDVEITGASGGSSTKVLSSLSPYNHLTINAGVTYTLDGSITVNEDLNINAGTLDVDSSNNYSINVAGSWTSSSTFNAHSGTVTFDGTDGDGDQIDTSGGSAFNNLTINGSGETWTLQNNLDVDGNLTLSAGTLDVSTSDYTINLAGDLTNNATFNERLGKVILDGGNQTLDAGGNTMTFFQLEKTVGSTATLTLNDTSIFEIMDLVKLQGGGSSNKLNLVSDDGTNKVSFYLSNANPDLGPAGITQNLNYLDVTRIDSSSGVTMTPDNSTADPDGSNINWDFDAGTTITWEGDFSTEWSSGRNWDAGKPPRSNDDGVIPDKSGTTNDPTISSVDPTVKNLTINSGGLLTTSGRDITVTGTFTNNGEFRLNGGESITEPSNGSPSTIRYQGTGSQTIKDWTYHHLTIQSSGNGTFTLNSTETLGGNLTVAEGIFDVNDQTLSIDGNTTVEAGSELRTGTAVVTFGDSTSDGDSVTVSGGNVTIESDDTVNDLVLNADTSWSNSGGTVRYSDVLFEESFDPATNDNNWSSLSGGSLSTCAAVDGNGFYFYNVSGSREVITKDLNVSGAGDIIFYMKIWDSGDSSCSGEQAEAGEGVDLEYSTDGGSNWNNIQSYAHSAANSFTRFEASIPAGAQTASTRFRWIQTHSGTNQADTWALDNIKIDLDGNTNTTKLRSDFSAYNNLRILADSGVTYTLDGNITVNNDITIDNGTVDVDSSNNYSITVSGDWTNNGGFQAQSGLVTFDSGTQLIDAGGSGGIGSDDSTKDFNDVTVTGNILRLSGSELEIDGTLTINSGKTVELNGNNLDLNGTLSNSGTLQMQGGEAVEIATMDVDSGLVSYVGDGTGSASTHTLEEFGTDDYWNLEINDTSGSNADTFQLGSNIKVKNDLDVLDSTMDTQANTLDVLRDTRVAGGATLSVNGTANITRDLTINNNGTLNVNSTTNVDRDVTNDTGGTISVSGSPTFTVAEAWTNSGSFSAGSGTVDFDGTGGGNHGITTGGDPFYDLTVSGSTTTWELKDSTQVKNSITVSAGTLSVPFLGQTYKQVLEDDFDGGEDGSDWAALNSATADSCTTQSGSDSLYFDSNSASRNAETVDFDMRGGGTIDYYFWYGDSGGCGETPESGEDITVEYSVDGGSSWTTIKTLSVDSYSNGTWHSDSISIPAGARTSSTRFRWNQPSFSDGSSTFDNWRIDEVTIVRDASSDDGLMIGDQDGTGETKTINISGGTLKINGNSTGRALLTTAGTSGAPSTWDRIDLQVSGTLNFDKVLIYFLTSSGIQFKDEATISKLKDTVFDFGTDGGGTGKYLNFDSSSAADYNVKTPLSTDDGPAIFREVEFRNALKKSGLKNVDATNDTGGGAIDFQTSGGSDLSTNAIKFVPVAGPLAGADHELDVAGDKVRWGEGAALRKDSSGNVVASYGSLQAAINNASSGETITQDGNNLFSETVDLSSGPGNLTLSNVMVSGNVQGSGAGDTNTAVNVVVVGGNDLGPASGSRVGNVYNCLVKDGSIYADTAKNSVTVDTDDSGGHSITAGSSSNNVTNMKDSELAGYWDFESGSGSTATDQSQYSNNGTLNNMEAGDWVSDTPSLNFTNNYSLDFGGTDEYVSVPDDDAIQGVPITISCWVKVDTPKDVGISKGDEAVNEGIHLRIFSADGSDNRLEISKGDGSSWGYVYADDDISTGTWMHVAGSWDGNGNGMLYVDGDAVTIDGSSNTGIDPKDEGHDLWIGRKESTYFDGKIDDVRIYGRALKPSEITDLANGNNFEGSPFVDITNNDFHLRPSARALLDQGTGVASVSDTDFDGNPRGKEITGGNTYDSFDVKIQNPNGQDSPTAGDVYYIVMESGAYTLDGPVNVEAGTKTLSTVSNSGSWGTGNMASVTYSNSYTSPVVLGQVMSTNSDNWQSFWSRASSSKNDPPTGSSLYVGRHVGEDWDTSRASEILGYIVIETSTGTIDNNSVSWDAALGGDSVSGTGNTPPYTYSLGTTGTGHAVITLEAMDGGDGGWGVLYGSNPLNSDELDVAVDEDQVSDSDRNHTTEQIGYWAFDSTGFDILDSGDTTIGEAGKITGVGTAYKTVNLNNTYNDPVIVASYNLPSSSDAPAVTRVRTGKWDIGPDEYHPNAKPETNLMIPDPGTSWSDIGEIKKNTRSAAQCIYVPYVSGGTGFVKAYSVDLDGGDFGSTIGTFDGSSDVTSDVIKKFERLYVSKFWHNEWSDPGYRIYALVDTDDDSNDLAGKLYAFRHVDTTSDGIKNVDTLQEDPTWGGTVNFTGKSLSSVDVDARRISVTLNDNYLYVVDDSDGTVYRRNTSDGTAAGSDATHTYDNEFFNLPQSWDDIVLMGIRDESNEVAQLSADLTSVNNTQDLGGSGRLINRFNFRNLNTGRMLYATTEGQPFVWKFKSDTLALQWNSGKSFDIGSPTRTYPGVFPGMGFIWGVAKDRVYKVTFSDGSKTTDWGSGEDWPFELSGKTFISDYAYWPFKDLFYVATEDGYGYFLNAVLDAEARGDSSSSTGEEDGTVVEGWPYIFPNRKIISTKLIWDGARNLYVLYVTKNNSSGDVRILAFPLP